MQSDPSSAQFRLVQPVQLKGWELPISPNTWLHVKENWPEDDTGVHVAALLAALGDLFSHAEMLLPADHLGDSYTLRFFVEVTHVEK